MLVIICSSRVLLVAHVVTMPRSWWECWWWRWWHWRWWRGRWRCRRLWWGRGGRAGGGGGRSGERGGGGGGRGRGGRRGAEGDDGGEGDCCGGDDFLSLLVRFLLRRPLRTVVCFSWCCCCCQWL